MNSKLRLSLILLCFVFSILALSCKKEADGIDRKSDEEFNFTSFGINLARDWKGVKLQGIDSYVGMITNGKDTLIFDFGMYSGTFDYLKDADYIKTSKKIDGKNAEVVRPKAVGKGILGVRIVVSEYKSLKITGVSKEEKVVLKMFDSIRFPKDQ